MIFQQMKLGTKVIYCFSCDFDWAIHLCYYFHDSRSSSLNEDNIISKFEVLPKLVESDHCPIQFNISNTKLDDHDDYNPIKK